MSSRRELLQQFREKKKSELESKPNTQKNLAVGKVKVACDIKNKENIAQNVQTENKNRKTTISKTKDNKPNNILNKASLVEKMSEVKLLFESGGILVVRTFFESLLKDRTYYHFQTMPSFWITWIKYEYDSSNHDKVHDLFELSLKSVTGFSDKETVKAARDIMGNNKEYSLKQIQLNESVEVQVKKEGNNDSSEIELDHSVIEGKMNLDCLLGLEGQSGDDSDDGDDFSEDENVDYCPITYKKPQISFGKQKTEEIEKETENSNDVDTSMDNNEYDNLTDVEVCSSLLSNRLSFSFNSESLNFDSEKKLGKNCKVRFQDENESENESMPPQSKNEVTQDYLSQSMKTPNSKINKIKKRKGTPHKMSLKFNNVKVLSDPTNMYISSDSSPI